MSLLLFSAASAEERWFSKFRSFDVPRGIQNRQLPYVYPDSYVSPASIQLSHGTDERDKTSHMGKVMTRVIIKQLTGCMNASPYICHHFSICLLALSHLVSLSVGMYGMYVCVVTVMPCTAQCSSINIPALQWKLQARGTLKTMKLVAHEGNGELPWLAAHQVTQLTAIPCQSCYRRPPTTTPGESWLQTHNVPCFP